MTALTKAPQAKPLALERPRLSSGTREAPRQIHQPPPLPRALLAELVGAFALTAVAAGGEVIAATAGEDQVSRAARAVAPGLVVMALIYAVSEVSGAHFNPAVTFSFAIRGGFPWVRAPVYWLAQVFGAVLSATMLLLTFGSVKNLGANEPHYGTGPSLVMEIFLTSLLVTVILGTANRKGTVGANAALAVGGTIALAGLIGSPISGASMNPARSLGPAFVSGALGDAWLYVIGPLMGALIAVSLIWLLKGPPNWEEVEAESGERQK
jgi:MIP family channel proteins